MTNNVPSFNADQHVSDRFRMICEIGSGSFGEVWLAVDRNGNRTACKVEPVSKKSRLRYEYKIYRILVEAGVVSIPRIYNLHRTPTHRILCMELLGDSLDGIVKRNGGRLSIGTVQYIAGHMLRAIQSVHHAGIIHRDIKPANFMVGTGVNRNCIYLVDFGLAKQYTDGTHHIRCETGRSLVGTSRYVSRNVHCGFEPSRRDDLESIGYVLIHMARGSLPWQGLKKRPDTKQNDLISEVKMQTPISQLCESLPRCFEEYMTYCRQLRFSEDPDYRYMIGLFDSAMEPDWIRSDSDQTNSRISE